MILRSETQLDVATKATSIGAHATSKWVLSVSLGARQHFLNTASSSQTGAVTADGSGDRVWLTLPMTPARSAFPSGCISACELAVHLSTVHQALQPSASWQLQCHLAARTRVAVHVTNGFAAEHMQRNRDWHHARCRMPQLSHKPASAPHRWHRDDPLPAPCPGACAAPRCTGGSQAAPASALVCASARGANFEAVAHLNLGMLRGH